MNNIQGEKCVLEIRNVSKRFPGVQALKNINLFLGEGEVHALIGENGAGKSTLMNVVFGLVQPSEGEILRNGEKVLIDSPITAQRLGIGIVPQELNLIPHLSVMENILLGMEPKKNRYFLDWEAMRNHAEGILQRLGESFSLEAAVGELSVAQQQMVQIARAMAFGAEILIFDEPTASLTARETNRLFQVIREFVSRGGSVFYISHRLEEILEIGHRITVLRDGEVVQELDPKMTTIDEMVKHMVGRELPKGDKTERYQYSDDKIVLRCSGLTRKGEFTDVSFSLFRGEILGIAGLVGSGRTELVRCLFGDTTPDTGTIEIGGTPVSVQSPVAGIRNGMGYLSEERRKMGIFPLLDVAENMTVATLTQYFTRGRIDRKRQIADVDKYVGELRIKTPSHHQLISNLSGGNQQKVILARWLLSGSRILLLDEPTRGIDVNAKAEICQLLRRLAQKGISIVFISSELQEVIDVADRILIMHEGKIKGEVSTIGIEQEEIMAIALS